ncbi:YqaA family protein [Phycisphaera mikurensis]|uniref:Hypothetical membrane protein n=1 Tax=Phycisphaera mikurensis (strain NBRC 102666 / KCTC 22515 / FYK2301M01) TaxID=1142394 RepID=I0IDS8_PHYMF|nr:VTT domain-containing protein [Phycisphaera mikurensis]MBB6441227.1 membrane protein YqaA with SNARE-associated domain [Phycisphaera mikurensis]BAM03416.1 hypothetical membrane protein [Phycisphaera mikurensis NBRC 102666]
MSMKDRAARWIRSRHMVPATAVVSFFESTVLPVPLEVLLVPVMQARRDRLWWLAAAALGGCVLGAVAGYWIGWGLMESIGHPLVAWLGQERALEDAIAGFNADGFVYVLGISLAPVPFQIAMLGAGAAGFPLWKFLLATLISRAIRYFGLAALVWWLGDRTEGFVKRHKRAAAIGTLVAVAAVFAWRIWS